jgi:hypothetical protein
MEGAGVIAGNLCIFACMTSWRSCSIEVEMVLEVDTASQASVSYS